MTTCFLFYREFEEGNEAVRATLELKVADLTRRAGEYGRESAAVVATGEVLAFTAQVRILILIPVQVCATRLTSCFVFTVATRRFDQTKGLRGERRGGGTSAVRRRCVRARERSGGCDASLPRPPRLLRVGALGAAR